jgi:hypothetical protein
MGYKNHFFLYPGFSTRLEGPFRGSRRVKFWST